MSHGTLPPKRQGNRHTKQPHPKAGPVNSADSRMPPTGWTTSSVNQDSPTSNPPPKSEEPPDDEPSWHRLLGTLLSSQGTDAHPRRPCNLLGGNRSNLAEPLFPVKSLVRGTQPEILLRPSTSVSQRSEPAAVVCVGGCLGDRPPRFFPRCPLLARRQPLKLSRAASPPSNPPFRLVLRRGLVSGRASIRDHDMIAVSVTPWWPLRGTGLRGSLPVSVPPCRATSRTLRAGRAKRQASGP